MKIILFAIPGFIILILAEWLYGLARGRNTYRVADTITSISLGSISRLRGLLFLGLGTWFYTWAADGYHLFQLPDQGIGIWLFALLAYDFSYYWFHRISHEVNLFWVHTQHVYRIGPLEYVLVTPSNHRVHHAQNDIYIDRNYGGILCIWDRMFGTFQDELADEPCLYGIRKPLQSYNPFWANVHVYWSTLLDSWRAARWQDKIKVWFKRPGWRPDGLAEAYPTTRTSLASFRKFDPPASLPVRLYTFFQFFCTTLAGTGLLIVASHWNNTDLLLAIGLVFLSFYLQSMWTEGRRLATALEWAKLALLFLALGYLPLSSSISAIFLAYFVISITSLAILTVRQEPAARVSNVTSGGK